MVRRHFVISGLVVFGRLPEVAGGSRVMFGGFLVVFRSFLRHELCSISPNITQGWFAKHLSACHRADYMQKFWCTKPFFRRRRGHVKRTLDMTELSAPVLLMKASMTPKELNVTIKRLANNDDDAASVEVAYRYRRIGRRDEHLQMMRSSSCFLDNGRGPRGVRCAASSARHPFLPRQQWPQTPRK
jgi:hypothetical protein